MNHKKNVTIADIAHAAGVSKTTVSRYINGRYDLMSAETRERIRKIIEMSNYHPNSIAQALKAQQSHQIGVVVSDISSPFSAALIRGIGHVLLENDYVALFADSKSSLELEERLIQTLVSRRVDGLIVNTSSYENPALIQLACQGFPVVLCDRYVNDYKFSFVGCDHRQPVLQTVAHLKEEGFCCVAFFTQEYAANSARFIRRNAYLSAMAEYYPHLDAQALCVLVDPSDPEATCRLLERLLAGCGAGNIPAIIAVNSVTAMHVLASIRSMGLSVPDDVGICGPDDWSWNEQIDWAAMVTPGGLTTFPVHSYEIGCTTARALLRQIQAPGEEKQEVLFPSELVVRRSTSLRAVRPAGGGAAGPSVLSVNARTGDF